MNKEFSKQMKNKLIVSIKTGDKLLGTDTLNRMYEYTSKQDEYKTLTSIAIAALNAKSIKTDEDIEKIKITEKLKVFLVRIINEWLEER